MPEGSDSPTRFAKKAEARSRPAANAFATPGRCPYNLATHVPLGFLLRAPPGGAIALRQPLDRATPGGRPGRRPAPLGRLLPAARGPARGKLQSLPCRAADEEDVTLSAFASFCRTVERKLDLIRRRSTA